MQTELLTSLVIALVGLAGFLLGCFNTWWNFRSRRVNLKVYAAIVMVLSNGVKISSSWKDFDDLFKELPPEKGALLCVSINVVNLSEFPVTISRVGFRSKKNKRVMTPNLPLISAEYPQLDIDFLPCRLESRAVIKQTIPLDDAKINELVTGNFDTIFAGTECGTTKASRLTPKALSRIARAQKSFVTMKSN